MRENSKDDRPTGDGQAAEKGHADYAPSTSYYRRKGPGSQTKLLEAALNYAEKFGWAVLPVKPQGKEPLTSHGVLDATTDVQVIQDLWARWPDANVAIACGLSKLVVIDLDADKGGLETWQDLVSQHNFDDDTVMSLTGDRGVHLVFAAPEGVDVRNSVGKLGPGVDVRAKGGYIVAPPSIHPNGRPYAWEVSAHPEDRDPTPLPAALLALLTEGSDQEEGSDAKATLGLSDVIPQGERNETLFRLACAARGPGATESEIMALLEAVNARRCVPPLDRGELEAIARSTARYDPTKRRTHARRLGARTPAKDVEAIKVMAPKSPDPELRGEVWDILLGDGLKELRRRAAGQAVLNWLREHGGFVRSQTGQLFYFSRTERRLFSLDADLWKAWLYALTGANPSTTDFSYLADLCQATALLDAPTFPIVRVAAWDDDAQVLRVSRFDGTVYVLDGEGISEEPNGQSVIFDDDPLWLSYKPDFSAPGALTWLTSELPNFDGDRYALGLAFLAWIITTFFSELCPTRPLLVFLGEKGSGKSMVLRILLRLMLGSVGQLAGVPDRPDGFTAAAAAVHILAIDNLDEFTGWLRDKLARISTGAEDYYRKLYTSNERGRAVYRCWLAFTARTPDTLRRDDLADRLLLLPVAHIGDDIRRPERDFLERTSALRDLWWGDVLTILNDVVARIRRGELDSTSKLRMADWESLGRLVARREGKEDTWKIFINALERSQSEFLLESDLIVDALDSWLKDRSNQGRGMTSRELYEEWTQALFGEKKPPKDWPGSTKSLGKRLANIRRDLQALYRVEWSTDSHLNTTVYRFWPKSR